MRVNVNVNVIVKMEVWLGGGKLAGELKWIKQGSRAHFAVSTRNKL